MYAKSYIEYFIIIVVLNRTSAKLIVYKLKSQFKKLDLIINNFCFLIKSTMKQTHPVTV